MILIDHFTTVIQRLRLYETQRRFQWQKMARIRKAIEIVADEFEGVVSPWFSSPPDPDRTVSIQLVGELLSSTTREFSSLVIQSSYLVLSDPCTINDPQVIAARRAVNRLPTHDVSIDFPAIVRFHLDGECDDPPPIEDQQPCHVVADVLDRYFGSPSVSGAHLSIHRPENSN